MEQKKIDDGIQNAYQQLLHDIRAIVREEIAIAQSQKPPSEYEDLITEGQLQEKIGNVSASTLWRLEKRGRLNPIRVGKNKMYKLSEVLAMEKNNGKEQK